MAYTFLPSATQKTKDFLSACKISQHAKEIASSDNVISRFNKFIAAWKIKKEKICTFHHHIGHYKASLINNRIRWFLFQRTDISELTGYSPKRHQNA